MSQKTCAWKNCIKLFFSDLCQHPPLPAGDARVGAERAASVGGEVVLSQRQVETLATQVTLVTWWCA